MCLIVNAWSSLFLKKSHQREFPRDYFILEDSFSKQVAVGNFPLLQVFQNNNRPKMFTFIATNN